MQFVKYTLFGGIGVISDYIIYYFLLSNGFMYQFANASGYMSGTMISFFLNRNLNFKVKDNVLRRMMIFFVVAFIGYLVSVVLLLLYVEYLLIDPMYSKPMTLPVILLIQFLLNKKITFIEKK